MNEPLTSEEIADYDRDRTFAVYIALVLQALFWLYLIGAALWEHETRLALSCGGFVFGNLFAIRCLWVSKHE